MRRKGPAAMLVPVPGASGLENEDVVTSDATHLHCVKPQRPEARPAHHGHRSGGPPSTCTSDQLRALSQFDYLLG